MCDEERYLELNTDIAEKIVYEEEEWKRYQEALNTGYNAVGFSYEQSRHEDNIYHQDVHQTEDEKPFTPSAKLNIPSTIEMPPTVKMNAVIEKTAKFIAEHGAQMEIVLKAKQAGNSQFDFLDYKSKLNSYYKFMVDLIKTGKYIPKTEVTENQEENTDHHEHGYLHKSLDTTKVEPTKSIKMPSVSIHDTPYGQLVKSIKKHHKEEASSSTSLQQQPVAPSIVQKTSIDNSHADDFQDCQYDFSVTANVPAPPGTEPVDLPFEQKELYGETKGPVKSFSEGVPPIIPPPPDVQPIIDRMAMYVAKNGNEFEIVVKSKNDSRFRFLNDWHVHFPYYHFRKMMHLEEIIKEKKEKEEGHASLMNRGVSFSIKTRLKEPEAVTPLKKPFFDYGSSDDEGEFDSQNDVSLTQSPLHDASDKTESNQDSNTGYISGDASDDIEDKKLADDRLMNRLATVAREKLAQTSKEKQMQAERKRKAAMFISLLKGKQEHNTEENEKKLPIVFDYGHKSLDSKSKSPQCYSRSSSPPLSYSKLRRSLSRSPSRKGVNSCANTSTYTFRKQQSKHQTNITYNPPKCTQSPKLSRSRSRSRHRSPRSGNSIRKSSRSRRDVEISKRSLSKQSNSTEYQQERKSKEKPLHEGKCVNLPVKEHVTIKQEKFDPSFEKSVIHDNICVSKDDTNTNTIFSNTKGATNELTDTKNEVIDDRDDINLSEHKSVDDDDDDVEIIEVPPKSIEPECLVDLTQIESDSDDDKFRSLKMENLKREQNFSRSTVGRKRYRRSKSPRSRQSTSPYYRSKSSPSCSPKRRRYLHSKSSKRRRSRSRSPKHRKHHSRSPKHRRSRSVRTRKSRSASLSKKHKSPNRKRSRTPKTKKRKNRSPSRSPKQNKKKIKNIEREGVTSETLPDFVKSIKDETEERLRQLESEGTENTKLSKASAKTSQEVPEYKSASTPPKNLLHKVRAMLKASRDVLRNNEDTR